MCVGGGGGSRCRIDVTRLTTRLPRDKTVQYDPCTNVKLPHAINLKASYGRPPLETPQGQFDGFFSQLPYKCYQNRVASAGD